MRICQPPSGAGSWARCVARASGARPARRGSGSPVRHRGRGALPPRCAAGCRAAAPYRWDAGRRGRWRAAGWSSAAAPDLRDVADDLQDDVAGGGGMSGGRKVHRGTDSQPGSATTRCVPSARVAGAPRTPARTRQAPHAIDDAGNGRQQLDGHTDGPLQPARREFRDHQGNPEADRNAHQQRDHRGDHRAVERGQGPELLGDRVPFLTGRDYD